ncbi:MAG: glycosyltransferase family 1 protein [Cyclobacteriaceae bacterium]
MQEGKMKNICIFIDVVYGVGGTFQYNQQILAALLYLPKHRYNVTVFYVDDAWANLIPKGFERRRLHYPEKLKLTYKILFGIGLSDRMMRFLFLKSPLKPLADPSFDLVLFPSQDLAGLFLAANPLNVVHDLMHRYEKQFKESSGLGRRKFRDRLFASMCKFSRVVLVDSNVGKIQLIESYGPSQAVIEALPYIAPSHIVNYDEKKHNGYFEKISLPAKFIFYPAQFWPHKNHKILIEATRILKERLPDFHLLFTGPKNHAFSEIHNYCKKYDLLNNITFLDYVPNDVLGGFYKRARALVMPTYYGPTNIPPLEAIAMGCPVAVSGIYGMPEQLGNAALYFDNTRLEDVVKVLEQLWTQDNLCAELRKVSEKHFLNWNEKHFNLRLYEIIEKHSVT